MLDILCQTKELHYVLDAYFFGTQAIKAPICYFKLLFYSDHILRMA